MANQDGAGPTDPSTFNWEDAVRALARPSVLVVGDAMLDRYVYGVVDRVSPEAPIPVIRVTRELAMPGGAGNVVRNLNALGAAVVFVSAVGDDQAGSEITGLIGGHPNVEPWLLVQGGRLTTVKTRYVAAGQQMLRADQEDAMPIQAKLAGRMLRIAADAMPATRLTVLSDYGKGLFAGEMAPRLIAAARQAGRRVIVDPKGPHLARFAGADVVIPNAEELAVATDMRTGSDTAIVAAARALAAAHDFGAVLVTRGGQGMTLIAGEDAHHFAADPVEVADVAGAGDTVAATLAAALGSGLSLRRAAALANLAAGLVVAKPGTAVIRPDDLRAGLRARGERLDAAAPGPSAAPKLVRSEGAAVAPLPATDADRAAG